MKQKAVVLETDGRVAKVSVFREDACGSCAGRHVCGGAKKFDTSARNGIGAEKGDIVEIEARSGGVLLYAALVFLMPVLLAIVLYAAFSFVGTTASYIAATLGFVVPFAVAFVLNKKVGEKTLPEITAVLTDDTATTTSSCPL